ncbi:polymorphic toxin-type HINT domain-containing protein [Sebaldella sp. S0638]|uniref:polymorphic toxin-type HINT domain-containing protein n=1 Tax=Sebaldella sp. S0638 TaxID=2957809 RepID=UPI00209ED694|nr:polymorphic toxin-type HINT domain-containing protein [Sebaldella sp. S0638]MCP1225530.1 polymorphic toxin-type HINT domain-containing protein [Sebaldella sp. S0638]
MSSTNVSDKDTGVRRNNQKVMRYKNADGSVKDFSYSGNRSSYEAMEFENGKKGLDSIKLTESEAKALSLGMVSSFEYVVNGAKLTCTGCPGQKVELTVMSQFNVRITGQLAATVMDKLPLINIPMFESCKFASSGLCMPRVAKWVEYHPEKHIHSHNALIKKSKGLCEEKGIIEVFDTGQTVQAERNGKLKQELEDIINSNMTEAEKLAKASEVLSKYNGKEVAVEKLELKSLPDNPDMKYIDLELKAPPSVSGSHSMEQIYPGINGNINGLNESGVFVKVSQDQYIEDYYSTAGATTTKIKGTPSYMGNNPDTYYISKENSDRIVSGYNQFEGEADRKREEWGGKINDFSKNIDLSNGHVKIPGIEGNVYIEKVSGTSGNMNWRVYDPYGELNRRENAIFMKALADKGITAKPSHINTAVQKEQMIFLYERMGPEAYNQKYTNIKDVEQWSKEKMAFDALTNIAEGAYMGRAMKIPAPDSVVKMRNSAFGNEPVEVKKGKVKTGAGVNSKAVGDGNVNQKATACFIAGTLIWGKVVKAIEEIRAGDYVYSYNEGIGQSEERKVLQTFIHDVDEVLDIYLGNDTVITTTEEHPFYVNGKYINAGELKEGMLLMTNSCDKISIVKIVVKKLKEKIKVYNIEVDGNHNYFVGDSFVLVHNKTKNFIPYTDEKRKHIIPPEDGYEAFLEREYIDIRKVGLDDGEIVAKNTGLSQKEVIDMKKHLFLDTHNLSHKGAPYKELYFQADPEIAHIWKKAQIMELNDVEMNWFRQLADHELTEKSYMDAGLPLRDISTYSIEKKEFLDDPVKNAHNKANLTAPQPKTLDLEGVDLFDDWSKYFDKDKNNY